jgi:DNA-binding YbaB/EbfC family protein
MAKNGFRGGGYGGMNQAAMMKQAQKMQQDLLKMQEDLENQAFTASAGGGAVSATVSGKHAVTALTISPDAVDPNDVEMLQDMVMAAVNEALRQADEASSQSMSRLTSGLNLPF